MEVWLPLLGFAPLTEAAQLLLYVGQSIKESGPLLDQPLLVVIVVVVGAVDPEVIVSGIYYCSKYFLLLLMFPCMRSDCLLLN